MGKERERLLTEGLRVGSDKACAAKRKFHQKLVVTRPWRALAEEWREEMWRVFGKEVVIVPWRKKEEALARKLLKEVEYDTAVKMVRLFISSWSEAGLPVFPFLWVRRESVLAMVTGQAKTRR